MSAELLDLPITNERQVARIFADVMPDPSARGATIVAIYNDLPAEYQGAVWRAINSLNRPTKASN
jgi:hypothetical protein